MHACIKKDNNIVHVTLESCTELFNLLKLPLYKKSYKNYIAKSYERLWKRKNVNIYTWNKMYILENMFYFEISKSKIMNKLCSRFEVVISQNELSVRFCVVFIRWPSNSISKGFPPFPYMFEFKPVWKETHLILGCLAGFSWSCCLVIAGLLAGFGPLL